MAAHLARRAKRVCLLTGAGGRLGAAFCRQLACRYEIVAVCRTRAPAAPSQEQVLVDPLDPLAVIPRNAHPVFVVRADLSSEDALERIVELTLARFGRVDLVVNAAVHSEWAPIVESKRLLDGAARQFLLNAIVPLKLGALVARHAWRGDAPESRGQNRNIVNVSSTAGLRVYPGLHQSVYGASKAALNFLTLHMADEFSQYGARVNAVAPNSFPGIVSTERVVKAITRLDRGRMTGKILAIDRGGERFVDPTVITERRPRNAFSPTPRA